MKIVARLGYLLATRDERGASAVEYGLLVVGVALAFFAVTRAFEDVLGVIFRDALNGLSDAPQ